MLFYSLSTSGTWIYGWGQRVGQTPWEDLFSGALCPKDPLDFEIPYPGGGEKLPDMLGIGGCLRAVSPRMLQVLESIGATGYRAHPIVLKHALLGITIHGYQGLLVHGSGGPLDEERSKVKRSSDGGAILSCEGYYIDEDQWDKSDVFRIEGLGYSIWVTERVAEALGKMKPKLRNVALTPNTERWPVPRGLLAKVKET